ncbi:MAG: AAA family ATPase [Senegalia sp. (in: firmicutes)]|uniref:AAA family ATPase n=1 Tax=Senegalia sp. (in: firmicutes) TaxID=1924098 RepID=UPI003F9A569F
MSEESYDTVKALLNRKKNIILQGPPGVGKTFIAKRLAYSIIGKEDETKIEMIQFHQSYSYEDFIMGYRPSGNGFELKEGPFYKFCKEAEEDLENDYYFIIDEINRGNLSKIFGELMMLVENNKRGEEISLTYSDESFSVPENVYIIGMMNTADRSLAIIDYALRRRFSFFDIEPTFESDGFKNLLIGKGMDEALIQTIKTRINYINSEIENDVNLGKGFKIGHSYFCDYDKREDWYEEVIKYEIAPLIREYWFDEEDKAKSYIEGLLR